MGYKEVSQKIEVGDKSQYLEFKLKTVLLNEVQVVSDVARDKRNSRSFQLSLLKNQ